MRKFFVLTLFVFLFLITTSSFAGMAEFDTTNLGPLAPDTLHSCSLQPVVSVPSVFVLSTYVGPRVYYTKEVWLFNDSTDVMVDCWVNETGVCNFRLLGSTSILGIDVIECHEVIASSGGSGGMSVEMASLLIGGLFGLAFTLGAVWRF